MVEEAKGVNYFMPNCSIAGQLYNNRDAIRKNVRNYILNYTLAGTVIKNRGKIKAGAKQVYQETKQFGKRTYQTGARFIKETANDLSKGIAEKFLSLF